ncbi:hypothetical protein HRbin11_02047 [bacterium HR11]|mgnify:CR=1 FL=1|nr:hypothetical protein HRbin11_02047 [bacterium HR11]
MRRHGPSADEDLKRDLQAIRQALKNPPPERPAPRWLHITVDDLERGAKVRVNLPVEAVVAFLELAVDVQEKELARTRARAQAQTDRPKTGEVIDRPVESLERSLEILRPIKPRLWIEWLKDLPNGEIVTVEAKDAKIRIWVE